MNNLDEDAGLQSFIIDVIFYNKVILLFQERFVHMIRKIARILAETKSIRGILEHPADLSEFRERLTPRLIAGLILMGFSYLIGWPAVTALSMLAVYLQEPLIAIIGCPTTYGLSCLVFLIGAWFARAPHYLGVVTRYAIGKLFLKLLR